MIGRSSGRAGRRHISGPTPPAAMMVEKTPALYAPIEIQLKMHNAFASLLYPVIGRLIEPVPRFCRNRRRSDRSRKRRKEGEGVQLGGAIRVINHRKNGLAACRTKTNGSRGREGGREADTSIAHGRRDGRRTTKGKAELFGKR